MKTLLEVASTLGNLVSKKAPKKTRNLKNRLKEANTGRKIIGGNSAQAEKRIINDLKSGTNTFEFGIDIAPQGAEYGQFWNDTDDTDISWQVKNRKTKNNPDAENYGSKAYESTEFQRELDTYIDSLTDKLFESISKQIDKELK
jgi:hypothetical protein